MNIIDYLKMSLPMHPLKHNTLPPEWHKQSGGMLTWPHHQSFWVDTLDAIDEVFTAVATEISHRQPVLISCLQDNYHAKILRLLSAANAKMQNIKIYTAPADDIWVRDHGPICILQEQNRIC